MDLPDEPPTAIDRQVEAPSPHSPGSIDPASELFRGLRPTILAGWGQPEGAKTDGGIPSIYYRSGLIVSFDKDGIFSISKPMFKGPAWNAGLRTGSRIIRIDNWDTAGHTVEDCCVHFGFARKSWFDAVQRGAVIPGPRLFRLRPCSLRVCDEVAGTSSNA